MKDVTLLPAVIYDLFFVEESGCFKAPAGVSKWDDHHQFRLRVAD